MPIENEVEIASDAGAAVHADDGKVAITQVSYSPKVQPNHEPEPVLTMPTESVVE